MHRIQGSEDPCSLRKLLPVSNRNPNLHPSPDWIQDAFALVPDIGAVSDLATTHSELGMILSAHHILRAIQANLIQGTMKTRRSRMGEMSESAKETGRSIRQLLVITALLVIGYTCIRTFRFAVGVFNLSFVCAFLMIPFLAIRPVLRLPRQPRIWGLMLLTPLLLISSFLLLGTAVLDGLLGGSEHTQPLQTFQLGGSTVQLERYSNGGAMGVHGLNLEQRRLLIPGLYIVKSVAFFDSAREGALSVEGPYRVRVEAKGNYSSNNYVVDKVYFLKPWVYF